MTLKTHAWMFGLLGLMGSLLILSAWSGIVLHSHPNDANPFLVFPVVTSLLCVLVHVVIGHHLRAGRERWLVTCLLGGMLNGMLNAGFQLASGAWSQEGAGAETVLILLGLGFAGALLAIPFALLFVWAERASERWDTSAGWVVTLVASSVCVLGMRSHSISAFPAVHAAIILAKIILVSTAALLWANAAATWWSLAAQRTAHGLSSSTQSSAVVSLALPAHHPNDHAVRRQMTTLSAAFVVVACTVLWR